MQESGQPDLRLNILVYAEKIYPKNGRMEQFASKDQCNTESCQEPGWI